MEIVRPIRHDPRGRALSWIAHVDRRDRRIAGPAARVTVGRFARRLIPGILAVFVTLGAPLAALSATAYRIATDPAEPRVGEPTTILVSTLVYVDPPAIPSEPLPLDEFLWTFVAESPKGERHEIALTRVDESTNQWSGTSSSTRSEGGRSDSIARTSAPRSIRR